MKPPRRMLPAAKFRQQGPSGRRMSVCVPSPRRYNISKALVPSARAQLESFGLQTVGDLLHHLPFRYEDRRANKKHLLRPCAAKKQLCRMPGELYKTDMYRGARSQMLFGDASRRHRQHRSDLVSRARFSGSIASTNGQILLVHGKIELGMHGRLRIAHPAFRVDRSGRIRAIATDHAGLCACPAGIVFVLDASLDGASVERIRRHIREPFAAEIASVMACSRSGAALARLHDAAGRCAHRCTK